MGIFNMLDMKQDTEAKPVEDKKVQATKVDDSTVAIKDTEDKQIELNGSLSEVYTKALDEMYAAENMGSLLNLTLNRVEEEKHEEKTPENELYVHIADQDKLEEGDIASMAGELKIALDKKNYRHKVVVMECSSVDNRIGLLKNYLTGLGIECITSRTTALEMIKSHIKV